MEDGVERPLDGSVEGDGGSSGQMLDVDGHVGENEDPIIEASIRDEEHVVEGRSPLQAAVTQYGGKLDRNHVARLFERRHKRGG